MAGRGRERVWNNRVCKGEDDGEDEEEEGRTLPRSPVGARDPGDEGAPSAGVRPVRGCGRVGRSKRDRARARRTAHRRAGGERDPGGTGQLVPGLARTGRRPSPGAGWWGDQHEERPAA